MRTITSALTLAAVLGAPCAAQTTQIGPSEYRVESGVGFELGNAGASDYRFNWSDTGGTFANIADPTIYLTEGETYTFVRTSGSHPFIIMDDSAASFITGTDGSFQRTTTNGALLDSATLAPIADFTADPAPSGDVITWTPVEGDYWYTCRVTGHVGMTGRIVVEAAAQDCAADFNGDGVASFPDVGLFLTAFTSGSLDADFNGDGAVSFPDVGLFLAAFSAGCP